MKTWAIPGLLMLAAANAAAAPGRPVSAASHAPDPRLQERTYDPQTVITVPVRRGIVTLIALDADESITEVAAGLGGDCSKPESAWCIAAQPGGRTLFVKAKSAASAPNNLAVITDRRTHMFNFVVQADGDAQPAVFRLTIKAPLTPLKALPRLRAAEEPATESRPLLAMPLLAPVPPLPSPAELVAARLHAKAEVRNTNYSIAEGPGSEDIVPSLVFDDGRFTYLRFPGNREVPAVFHVQGDGSEAMVNARMEDELLVVDRVSRRLTLRAGAAVVGVWNEAFDLDGSPPIGGTTSPGVERNLKSSPGGALAPRTGSQPGARP